MAKQGMARPDRTHPHPRNDAPPVPEIQGKIRRGKGKADPGITGIRRPEPRASHVRKGDGSVGKPNP